jgi:hypothetical protein
MCHLTTQGIDTHPPPRGLGRPNYKGKEPMKHHVTRKPKPPRLSAGDLSPAALALLKTRLISGRERLKRAKNDCLLRVFLSFL